jgi:hypothetical protein
MAGRMMKNLDASFIIRRPHVAFPNREKKWADRLPWTAGALQQKNIFTELLWARTRERSGHKYIQPIHRGYSGQPR